VGVAESMHESILIPRAVARVLIWGARPPMEIAGSLLGSRLAQ
jgi:hypothetical protein